MTDNHTSLAKPKNSTACNVDVNATAKYKTANKPI